MRAMMTIFSTQIKKLLDNLVGGLVVDRTMSFPRSLFVDDVELRIDIHGWELDEQIEELDFVGVSKVTPEREIVFFGDACANPRLFTITRTSLPP